MIRRIACLLTPFLLPMALLTSGCALDPEDNPATTLENAGEGNVGGITPQELKDRAEQYQGSDPSGLSTDSPAPTTP